MPLVRKLITWLTSHPNVDEIARALVMDYLSEFSARGIRFSQLQKDDSIIILGEYGFEDTNVWANRAIPSGEWRARDTEPAQVLKGERSDKWCNNSTIFVETLRDRGVTQGHLMVIFGKSISEQDMPRVSESIQDLCTPLALYLSFATPKAQVASGETFLSDARDAGAGQMTQRQILILRGMVEGKTNHELATEMGFSVSTIRHETMRIYQALSVSDRKEAAKKAITLSLI
jgi:DNA-binding CsgD family transcriptional regulator